MFIVEGRALGVLAALGVLSSMVVVFDRLSDVADSPEPRSPITSTTASAASLPPMPHEDRSALANRFAAARQPTETVASGGESQIRPAKTPSQPRTARTLPAPPHGADMANGPCNGCTGGQGPLTRGCADLQRR